MKITGIVRKVDELGRVVIPVELRRNLGIEIKDDIEMYMDGEYFYVCKYKPACNFCESEKDVVKFKGKYICRECIGDISGQK